MNVNIDETYILHQLFGRNRANCDHAKLYIGKNTWISELEKRGVRIPGW